MEDAVAVHVLDGLEQLVDVSLHSLLGQVVCTALDRLVQVHFHQLKHQRQSPSWLIANQLDGLTY